ncbi:MAG: 3-phosphoshikimate 1-carboxyvinyltransferase, partial [Oscillospiraceae bacterium]
MNMKLYSADFHGELCAPSSKSEGIRALILASLGDLPTKIAINNRSEDVNTTIDCLRHMGSSFLWEDSQLTVTPVAKIKEGACLNCRECGAALRFLLPLTKALGEKVSFEGTGRLPQRPMEPLVLEMERMGCEFSCHSLPFFVGGKLHSGKYFLPANISSQFISGLLMALPLLQGDSE